MHIVDADGHVAEGATLVVETLKRWPLFVAPRADGKPGLAIEGRNHPEDSGPGAGVYGYLLTDALANQLSAAGGLGLGPLLQQQLSPRGSLVSDAPSAQETSS